VYSSFFGFVLIRWSVAALVALVLAGAVQPATAHHPITANVSECICKQVSSTGGWCAHCGVGYVASIHVPSADLFDLIDPGGHRIESAAVSCTICIDALKRNAYCDRCRIGYVDGLAYMSKLAYLVALGEAAPPGALAPEQARLHTALGYLARCEYCASAAFSDGRCHVHRIRYRDGKPMRGVADAVVQGKVGR
jgi:hypothetical protein